MGKLLNIDKIDFEAYEKSLDERIKALFYYFLQLSSHVFLDDLKKIGPDEKKEPGYLSNLEVFKLEGDDPRYVVALDRDLTRDVSREDNNSIIYVKSAKDKDLMEILQRYHPFTYEYFPADLKDVTTYFRKVREDESVKIRQRNAQERGSVRMELDNIDYGIRELPPQVNMVEDIGFKILRSELGFGPYPGHWIVALYNFGTGKKIKRKLNQKLAERILLDPTYTGYNKLPLDDKLMDADEINRFKEFMEYLV